MYRLKIRYVDSTELPNNGGKEQIVIDQDAEEILNNNNLTLSDLPCYSIDETYYIEGY